MVRRVIFIIIINYLKLSNYIEKEKKKCFLWFIVGDVKSLKSLVRYLWEMVSVLVRVRDYIYY